MFSGKEKSKLLLIDDESVNIRALTNAIDPGHEIHFATNASDSLELIQKIQFDLILLDVLMPDMDGFNILYKTKSLSSSLNSETPVIFVTASISEKDETKGLQMGAVDYICKPFHPAAIQLRVRNHLRTKKMYDFICKLSNYDALTELPNRRLFKQTLIDEWNSAIELQKPLSLIMIDIDFFKHYNDQYGHIEGDICLKRVAQNLAMTIEHSSYFMARYGGEEFICLLPDTDGDLAQKVAEQIKQNICQLNIPHSKSLAARHITISLGLATIRPTYKLPMNELINTADKNLYLAKKRGRNRVIIEEKFPLEEKPVV